MGRHFQLSFIFSYIYKTLFSILLTIHLSDLVILGDPEDGSLKGALRFVECRERDLQLQDNDYYGQPEDIGYGYQKNFGIFENGPAKELGSPDSEPVSENAFRNLLDSYGNGEFAGGYNKRGSNFRERLNSLVPRRESDGNEDCGNDVQCLYKQMLKDLWCKYLETHSDDVNIEDLSPEEVVEILNNLYEKEREEAELNDNSIYSESPYGGIPLRSRRNYRVFDGLNKRYPSFGEGFYGKRSPHSQHINYENPSASEFLYALKFVNPDMNREAVENLKDGYEVLGDEKDRDVSRILNDAVARPRVGQEEEAYWLKREEPEEETWLPGPVPFPSDDAFQDAYGSEKRAAPKIFKQHNGIHLNNKRIPVKRSPVRSKKEAIGTKELNEIIGQHQTTTTTMATTTTTSTPSSAPEKATTKKPTEVAKKPVSKPEVTKHRDVKKVVRRANDYAKDSRPAKTSFEIDKILSAPKVDKKSIDWSQYFGYDKRSQQWLRDDSIRRAENLFLSPKNKRYMNGEGRNFQEKGSRYEAPFDTRIFNSKKKLTENVDRNIDRMERKLGSIEERIIDDAVKYTGAHTGRPNEDLRKVKSEIVHHLEAAYSLEKMKNALEELKNSMKSSDKFHAGDTTRKSLTQTTKTETPPTTVRAENSRTANSTEKSKRVSTKKEIEDVYGKESLEYLNWPSSKDGSYPSNQNENSEACAVLDRSFSNCLKVEEITGKFSELLLPLCSFQQICYICGSEIGFSRPSACNLMYLTEAENLCQGNVGCLLSARNSMLAIRDIYEQDGGSHLGDGSCFFNPCIQNYFMNAPRAVVPLEFQD